MSTVGLLNTVLLVGNASSYYRERYKLSQEKVSLGTHVKRGEAWRAYVKEMKGQWRVFGALASIYATSIVGLLSMSSASSPVAVAVGLMCLIASLLSLLYCGVYVVYLPSEEDALRGLDWMENARSIPDTSWRCVPRLLTVAARWLGCATVTFVTFVLTTIWTGLSRSSAEESTRAGIVLAVLATTMIFAGLAQAFFVIPAFIELGKPGGGRPAEAV